MSSDPRHEPPGCPLGRCTSGGRRDGCAPQEPLPASPAQSLLFKRAFSSPDAAEGKPVKSSANAPESEPWELYSDTSDQWQEAPERMWSWHGGGAGGPWRLLGGAGWPSLPPAFPSRLGSPSSHWPLERGPLSPAWPPGDPLFHWASTAQQAWPPLCCVLSGFFSQAGGVSQGQSGLALGSWGLLGALPWGPLGCL